MNSEILSIIFVAIAVGSLYLYKLRQMDIYEKEPVFVLALVTIFGGFMSIGSSLLVYDFIEVEHNFLDAIIKIGLIEELSKLFALVALYRYIKKEFNEIVDGLIYITAISLGFAIIENIFYAIADQDPFTVLTSRSIFSILGHLSFSGYMGIAFYIHKKVHPNFLGIILAIFIATFAHGFYDGFLFHAEIQNFFTYVFVGLVFLQYRLFKSILGFSAFRKTFDESLFVQTNKTAFLKCYHCDTSLKVDEIEFWEIKAGKCHTCDHLVLNTENTARFFQYFRPSLNYLKFTRSFSKAEKLVSLADNRRIILHTGRTFLSANSEDLIHWLEEENQSDRKQILSIPIIGQLLNHIGLKYLSDK